MDGEAFEVWMDRGRIPKSRQTPHTMALLRAAFAFLQNTGNDYASRRLLAHFLLKCQANLKIAQIARLVEVTRSTASRQNQLSSREVIREVQHQLAGRPYGKLLPRYAGPIAQFLVTHPQASRDDLVDFIEQTWQIRVGLTALHAFLNKYGLDRKSLAGVSSPTVSPATTDEAALLPVLATPPMAGLPVPVPPDPFFFAHTRYAGAFLLLPQVIRWWNIAQQCFSDDYGSLLRGFLSSVFMLVVGIERVFHLETMDDLGFALLTGDPERSPSRHLVGAWRRHLLWNEVDSFCHRTSPWELLHDEDSLISLDEHAIPRWTRKFSIPKGFSTTRNKYMRCEKSYTVYSIPHRRFVTIKATPGNVELRDVSQLLLRRVLRFGSPKSLHALLDAGAGKSDADVRALLTLAQEIPELDVTLRACRYPHRVKIWKQLPADQFISYEEPGDCLYARPHAVRVAETTTRLKDESEEEAVRTIVCRQVIPGPKKDRWHPLYTSLDEGSTPREVLDAFRQRQHHEQGHRVEVHDEFLNAATCGYDKESPNRKQPRFCRGPLQMMSWLVALVYNASLNFADALSPNWQGAFIRTLRRTFFHQSGNLYITPTSVIVYFDQELADQSAVVSMIDRINAEHHRIPWMNNRLLVLSIRPDSAPRAGPYSPIPNEKWQ